MFKKVEKSHIVNIIIPNTYLLNLIVYYIWHILYLYILYPSFYLSVSQAYFVGKFLNNLQVSRNDF